jgi:hypothetical protein
MALAALTALVESEDVMTVPEADGKVIVVPSVPANVSVLEAVSVLPSAMVSVEPEAGAVSPGVVAQPGIIEPGYIALARAVVQPQRAPVLPGQQARHLRSFVHHPLRFFHIAGLYRRHVRFILRGGDERGVAAVA